MDAYITVTSTYNSSTVFWISIVCNIFGIILNSVFVYTSIKINDQKKLVDKTMLAVTVVKLCQAFVTIVKSSFKHSLGEPDFDISTLNIFGRYHCANLLVFIIQKITRIGNDFQLITF